MKKVLACGVLAATALMMAAGCMPGYSVNTMQSSMQPYSIAASFDLSRPWRLAVLPPAAGSDIGPMEPLVDYAGLQLMKVASFSVVDRSEVERVAQEQQFSVSGMVDPATAARLGKLMGAAAVVVVKVNKVQHDGFFSDSPNQRDADLHVKIISVETAEVLYSAQGQSSSFNGAEEALQSAVTVALMPLMERGGVR